MKAHTANLLNASVLIIMSAWAYYTSDTPSMTTVIPAIIGGILLACTGGVKSENKVIAHIAVLATFIGLLGLCFAMKGVIGRGADSLSIFRVGAMILTSIIAMVFFIKSFRDARIAREAAEKS